MAPRDVRSKNGLLKVTLTVRASIDANGRIRYCFFDDRGDLAPTLRVQPGDDVDIRLRNEISLPATASASMPSMPGGMSGTESRAKRDPCAGGAMSAASINLHFHGLEIPPVCHQDDTLHTVVEPGDPPFEYHFRVPRTQPPGLYWYHAHIHGFSEVQLLGGASGVLIVEGIERAVPRVGGLPERVLVIRDEWMPPPDPTSKLDPQRPTQQLSINYVPVRYPGYQPAIIRMRPHARELWRILNACADTYLQLYVEFGGKRRDLGLIALDGVPLRYGEPGAQTYAPETSFVTLPPASRADLIVTAPTGSESGRLMTAFVNRGPDEETAVGAAAGTPTAAGIVQDDVDPTRPLAAILVSTRATEPPRIRPAQVAPAPSQAPLWSARPVRKRTLYFSERLVRPGDPASPTLYFITEVGHVPAVFDPRRSQPDITVHVGDVEDWTIQNRSQEAHAFHIHQLHFIVIRQLEAPWQEPTPRDTVNVPAWSGFGPYPSVTLRMDFRDPRLVGTFPYHCHIAQHMDGGMMGTVRVEPGSVRP
jgi:FtsP/CotA-like multicopper oxidase with cupredoxin domain